MINYAASSLLLLGILLLIGAVVMVDKKKNSLAVLGLLFGFMFTFGSAFQIGAGHYDYRANNIPSNQLYYLESDPIASVNRPGDVFVLISPMQTEAFVASLSRDENLFRSDPEYYVFSKEEIEPGLKEGDIIIKVNGRMKKIIPVRS